MIITWIDGGLGNQLFQYAAGFAASRRTGMPLFLDLQTFENCGREYLLDQFNISGQIAPDDFFFNIRPRHRKMLSYISFKLRFGRRQTLYETHWGLNRRVFEIRRNTHLVGFWQSEKYFADCATEIRSEFKRIRCSNLDSSPLLQKLKGRVSVSIHIRRGDYLAPQWINFCGLCPMKYYVEGFARLKARLQSDPIIGVFSDDLEWARKNFRLDAEMIFVDDKFKSGAIDDFQLMSMFDHHIIANSTFSWWAAWLNPASNKIVICPDPFFRNAAANSRITVPSNWTKVRVDWN